MEYPPVALRTLGRMPVPASIVSFSSCVLLMCHFFFVLQFYGLLPAQFCCLLLAQSTIFTASVQCLRNESAYSVLKNRFSTIFSSFFLPILAWTSMFKSSVFQNFLQKSRKPIGTCPTGLIILQYSLRFHVVSYLSNASSFSIRSSARYFASIFSIP